MPFTPDSALDLLFPEELIPQHIKDQLPPELHVRLTPLGIFISFSIPLCLSDTVMRPLADSSVSFDGLRARPSFCARRAQGSS